MLFCLSWVSQISHQDVVYHKVYLRHYCCTSILSTKYRTFINQLPVQEAAAIEHSTPFISGVFSSLRLQKERESVPNRSYNYGFRARFVFPPSSAISAATPVGRADTRAVIKGGSTGPTEHHHPLAVHFLSNTLHTSPQQTHTDSPVVLYTLRLRRAVKSGYLINFFFDRNRESQSIITKRFQFGLPQTTLFP